MLPTGTPILSGDGWRKRPSMECLREITDMKGFWKDKRTGIVAEVISATEDAVWYQIPEWRGPQNCSREVFEKTMEPVTATPSPSNA